MLQANSQGADYSKEIFSLLSLELWQRIFPGRSAGYPAVAFVKWLAAMLTETMSEHCRLLRRCGYGWSFLFITMRSFSQHFGQAVAVHGRHQR